MSTAAPEAPPPPVVVCPECASKLVFLDSPSVDDVTACTHCGTIIAFAQPPAILTDAQMRALTGPEKQALRRQQLRGMTVRRATKREVAKYGELFELEQRRRGRR